MSRTVSAQAVTALLAAQSGDPFLILVRISHPDISPDIRVTSDGVDTLSNGETFVAYPFSIKLPSDTEEREPKAFLQISNVDRSIVKALREAAQDPPPSVTMQIVMASTPDTIEANFPDFDLVNGQYNLSMVTGELGVERMLLEPYPVARFTPGRFPGMFS